MKNIKAFALASSLGLLTVALPTLADEWNKRTILTINEPISVPAPGEASGKVLQPGKYVMKLMESPANRHIVQIFNGEESQLITTILAIPNYRLQPTGETQFGFWETPAGQPKALRSWFYPGDNFGQEFVYSKAQATSLATAAHEKVPFTQESDMTTARVGTVDQAGTEYELDKGTYTPPAQTAQATPQAAPQDSTMAQQTQSADRSADTSMAQNTPAQTPAMTESTPQSAPAMTESTPATDQSTPAMNQSTPAMNQSTPTMSNSDAAPMDRTHGNMGGGDTSGNTSRHLPSTASPFPLVGLGGLFSLGLAGLTRAAQKRS